MYCIGNYLINSNWCNHTTLNVSYETFDTLYCGMPFFVIPIRQLADNNLKYPSSACWRTQDDKQALAHFTTQGNSYLIMTHFMTH